MFSQPGFRTCFKPIASSSLYENPSLATCAERSQSKEPFTKGPNEKPTSAGAGPAWSPVPALLCAPPPRAPATARMSHRPFRRACRLSSWHLVTGSGVMSLLVLRSSESLRKPCAPKRLQRLRGLASRWRRRLRASSRAAFKAQASS